MNVNEAWSDVQTFDVDSLERCCGGDMRSDLCDFAILQSDIHHGVDMVFPVENVPVLQKEIVLSRRGLS
jgi:hypothetical protein